MSDRYEKMHIPHPKRINLYIFYEKERVGLAVATSELALNNFFINFNSKTANIMQKAR